MACCIFVAMIITNVLVYYRKVKALLGFRVDAEFDLWQPAPVNPPHPWRRLALPLLAIITLSFGVLQWDNIAATDDNKTNIHATH